MLRGRVIIQIADAENTISNSFVWTIKKERKILNLLYSIVDRIYIGRIPHIGTQALGAVGLCFPIIIGYYRVYEYVRSGRGSAFFHGFGAGG